MADDKLEIQRRYQHVRDLHERAKQAVLSCTIGSNFWCNGVTKDEAIEIAAEYFRASEELEFYERDRSRKHMEGLAKLGVEMELDGNTTNTEES